MKPARRRVTVKSAVEGLDPVDWIIRLDDTGITARRFGTPKRTTIKASWRAVLGILLVHKK